MKTSDLPNSPADPRKSWLRRAAGILAIGVSIGFLVYELYHQANSLRDYFSTPWVAGAVALCGAVYGAGLTFVCLAWRQLLWGWSRRPLNLCDAVWIFSTSNLLKYLPSNVLHLVGRYAALRQRGYSHQAIAWSLLSETVLLTVVAGGLSLGFVFPLFRHYAAELAGWRIAGILAAIGAGLALTAAYVVLRTALRKKVEDLGSWRERRNGLVVAVLLATLYCIGFFLVNGTLLSGLLDESGARVGGHFLAVVGVLSLAWIMGLLTPGAPAGLGVREAVMIAGLQWIGYAGDALGAAIAYRLVTLIGDGTFGLVGLALRPNAPALSVRD